MTDLVLPLLPVLFPFTLAGATIAAAGILLWRLPVLLRARDGDLGVYLSLLGFFSLHGLLLGGPERAGEALRSLWVPLFGLALPGLFSDETTRSRAVSCYLWALAAAGAAWFVTLSGGAEMGDIARFGFLRARAVASLQFCFGALAAAVYRRWGLFLFLSVVVFTMEGRMAMLAWGVGVAAAAFAGRVSRRFLAAGLAACLAILFAADSDWWVRWKMKDHSGLDTSLTHRLVLWKIAREEWLEHPVLGHGFGAFHATPDKTGPDLAVYAGTGGREHTHNSYLDVLHAGGIAGFFLLFGYYALWGRRLFRGTTRASHAAFLMLLAAGVSAWADKVFTTTLLMLPLWFWIGLARAEENAAKPPEP